MSNFSFTEWLELDEAKSRTFVAKAPKVKKPPRPKPAVHHDLDSWLQHVDNLKKELELLKGKLSDKKKPDVTKPEEPKKNPFKPVKPEDEKEDDDDTDKQSDDKDGDGVGDAKKPGDKKDKNGRVLPPVAADRVDFSGGPVPEHPVPGNRSSGRKPDSPPAPPVPQRRPRGVHGN